MFDFLFKRSNKAADAELALQAQKAAQQAALQESKKQKIEQARAAMLEKIERNIGNEAVLAEIVYECDFADGRYQAAQHIYSPANLNLVLSAVRKTDKRVAKLVQSRLDAIQQAAQHQEQALTLISQAQQIVAASQVTANQLVDLDRTHQTIGQIPAELEGQFHEIRQSISDRLLAQTALQRRVLDLIAKIGDELLPEAAEQLQQAYDEVQQAPEAAALPKNLLSDFQQKFDAARQAYDKAQQALAKAAQQPRVEADLSTEEVAGTNESAPTLATRPVKAERQVPKLNTQQILEALKNLEDALEQGSVLSAQAIDRELRGVDGKQAGLSNDQRDRLQRARSELAHLQGWAKWGGSISRDELIKAAEDLPKTELPVTELAKRVSGLRERWKSLEATTGGASKEVWERFDAACTLAYAPAAAHFQQLAEERKANLEKAEALLVTAREQATQLLQGDIDWKAVSIASHDFKQTWQKIGHVERKHKSRLDAAYTEVVALLAQPLEARRNEAKQERANMIAQVQAINPDQRNAVDQLKAIQAQWQLQAQAIPLHRKDEQALWDQFRAASDALFAQRRAVSESLDAQRKENLAAKEALCARLEQTEASSENAISKTLQDVANEWRAIGFVDRDVEQKIERRYQAAIEHLKKSAQHLREQKAQEAKQRITQKLQIAQRLEAALASGDAAEQAAATQAWNALPKGESKPDAALNARAEKAMKAIESQDANYVQSLQVNAAQFDSKILELEIITGIDSPAEFAQSRLQAQVSVLRNALKTGGNRGASDGVLQLLTLPALLTDQQRARFSKVLTVSATH